MIGNSVSEIQLVNLTNPRFFQHGGNLMVIFVFSTNHLYLFYLD